jgi:hypothetical protein
MNKIKAQRAAQRQRKKNATLLLLVSLAGVLLVVLAVSLAVRRPATSDFTPEVQGSSSLKADREKVDLGDVRLGETVQVSFELTNAGDRILRFARDPYIEVVEGC